MHINNEPCLARHALVDLNPNELRCNGSCNTFNDLSDGLCDPNKIKDVNLKVFNKITKIN